MLNRKNVLHYIFSFVYMLFASAAIQASGPPPYKGDVIAKSKLSSKVSTGIDNCVKLLEQHKSATDNTMIIGGVLFLFDDKAIVNKEPTANLTWENIDFLRVENYKTKNIEKLIKEKKGDDFNIKETPVSLKEFTDILNKVLNVDQLEKETGLQVSLKILNFLSIFKKKMESIDEFTAIQSDNIFNFVNYGGLYKFWNDMSLMANNYPLSQLVISDYSSDVVLKSPIWIVIDLKDPNYNDKNSNTNNNSNGNQELVKRILIGTAIVSPFLLLMGVFFYKKKKAAKKKNQLTQSPSSKYNTSVSSTTKERTTETTQKRPNQKRKAR